MTKAQLSIVTADLPNTQGKTYSLQGGKLDKKTAGAMVKGRVVVAEYADVQELSEILQSIQHDQTISSSVPKHELVSAKIVTKDVKAVTTGAIARTKDDFEFPVGRRGHITLDYDPQPGKPAYAREEIYSALCTVIPALNQSSVLWWCSGSSFIYDGDTEIQGLRGQRFYLLVDDVSDTERFGSVLATRLWLAGHGYIEISSSGAMLLRTIVDKAMFEAARLDYAGGAVCIPPLEQRRPPPMVMSEGYWFDTRTLSDLNPVEERAYNQLVETAKAKAEPEARAQRAAWEAERIASGVARLKRVGVPERQAVDRIKRSLTTALAGTLSGDFEVTMENGNVLTVSDILSDKGRYHEALTLDPLEPDYLGGKVVGHLNLLGGPPNLFSHAHGGAVYQLIATESRSFEDWQEAVIDAGDNVRALIDVAKSVDADKGLSKSEQTALLKGCAKAGNISLAVLREDLKTCESRGDTRPVIRIKRHDFAASVDECFKILPCISVLRQRSGQLVEVISKDYGTATITEVSAIRLGYLTSQAARWNYGDSDGGPDTGVLLAAMGAGSWPGVPHIEGLLHQPTIHLETGDVISGTGFVPSMHREAVFSTSEFPEYDGDDAMGLLRDLLKDFPFVDGRSESATLAAILTAAIRPSLPTAPGFMVSANDRGSGKTFLCELIGAFANVREVQKWPTRSEEQSKVLFSVLLEGRGGVVFDNLPTDWKSDTMCQILTSPFSSDRVLGASKTPSISTACLFMANGINVKPAGDLLRRVLTIELDARCERPWERDFNFDPVKEVRANRGKWLMIALRVLSDFIKGATKPELSTFGSFGQWSEVVRGAVVAAGLPDPLQALAANHDDADDEHNQLARLLWFWQECFLGEVFLLRDLVKAVGSASGETPEAGIRFVLEEIAGERDGINIRSLAAWFKRHRGRIIDGCRLVIVGDARMGSVWSVQRV